MFSNGQSIKDKNHTRAGAARNRKVALRRLVLRWLYRLAEKLFFSIEIVFTDWVITYLNRDGTRESYHPCPIPGVNGKEIT